MFPVNRRSFLMLGLSSALPNSLSVWSDMPMNDSPQTPIDRKALVSRHNVQRTQLTKSSPLQIGNGNFAFGADITGLQTFVPFNTMSQWGWHAAPLPADSRPEDFRGTVWETHGRPTRYPSWSEEQPELGSWLYANPNRVNLGRIGLILHKADGSDAGAGDLTACIQTLDLWSGTIDSRFQLEGQPVQVETCCHPDLDVIAVRIQSPLIAVGRLSIFLDFPRDDGREFANFVGTWNGTDRHQAQVTRQSSQSADILHSQDGMKHYITLSWGEKVSLHLPSVPSATEVLVITKAEYGSDEHLMDVTALVRSAAKGNQVTVEITNQSMGKDPILGQQKSLRVSYTLGGKPHKAEFAENEILQLPSEAGQHRYTLTGEGQTMEFLCAFAPKPLPGVLPEVAAIFAASAKYWPMFWQSGGAIDLSASRDPRWRELERRVILSQYLMAVNEAGALPPQESGLVNDGWHGKFHMEMYWWHGAHYALWNRWSLLNRSLDIYKHFLPSSQVRAKSQGLKGARWPKMTTADGWESTHPCNAMLIWQQPHPMFFAELDYRAHPTKETLERWRDILFNTADFLSSFAFWDEKTQRYVLGPPIYVVSENTAPKITQNPTYELSYWRFGLRIAQTWRKRLGLQPDSVWEKVLNGLSPLPVEDDLYVLYEGVPDMWTKFNFEHPALIGVYGMLPGDGVDVPTIRRTAERVFNVWKYDHTWGWDFPMLAMCAARLGNPKQAVDFLLHPSGGFQFDDAGYATGGPFPYFPSNGGLLYAIAMMAAGWDGAPSHNAPGFPEDGLWNVRWENLKPAL